MSRLQVVESALDLIGETPILHLRSFDRPGAASIFAKLENMNPGGSVKDRTALGMIRDAEARGLLKPGSTIVEPTAGNTGIGLALAGALLGYRVILVVPEKYSREKKQIMTALGATLEITPTADGMPGAMSRARAIAAATPGAFVPQQFENRANPDMHYRTTAREIWVQMQGKIDALVLGAGTGGTFSGVARYVKERNPGVQAILVESEGSVLGGGQAAPHKVEGIGNSFVPRTLDRDLVDEVVAVTDRDAFATAALLARREGVLVGGSSGAAAFAAGRVAERLGAGRRIVTLFTDIAERYLSQGLFDEVR
ncbi:MAG TPA: cysteine synthase A [Candidatus Polarisedimenticolia bacterium]|nr:cysteine synthase A [Candidatus Polarisedimenticolia bacterium]